MQGRHPSADSFEGYNDAENENAIDNINRYLKDHPELPRGTNDIWS